MKRQKWQKCLWFDTRMIRITATFISATKLLNPVRYFTWPFHLVHTRYTRWFLLIAVATTFCPSGGFNACLLFHSHTKIDAGDAGETRWWHLGTYQLEFGQFLFKFTKLQELNQIRIDCSSNTNATNNLKDIAG